MVGDDRARLAEVLDLQEGRGPVPVLDEAALVALLGSRPRVAVVGVSDRPGRPSREVFLALRRAGLDVVPVTPRFASVGGVPAYPDLAAAAAATGPFDIVDVFRRAEELPAPRRGGRGDRRPRPLAAARDRQLGGGPDRPRGRARCRDGSLPLRGALAPGRHGRLRRAGGPSGWAAGRRPPRTEGWAAGPSMRRSARGEDEPHDHQRNADRRDRGPGPGLPAQERHGDRRAGLLVGR